MNIGDHSLKEIGIYNNSNVLCGMGKKVVNRDRNVKEEGMYDDLDGL